MDKEEKIEVLDEASAILRKMNEIDELLEERMEGEMEEASDGLYDRYWHLIYDNFSVEELDVVKEKVGFNKFVSQIFLDELRKVLDRPRVIDEYEGYTLKLCRDCWGNESLFVFKDGKQYSEDMFYSDDEYAKEKFRNAIDADSGDPKFY